MKEREESNLLKTVLRRDSQLPGSLFLSLSIVRNNFLWMGSFLVFLLIFKMIVSFIALSSIRSVDITVETKTKGRLSIYYLKDSLKNQYSEKQRLDSVVMKTGERETLFINFKNRLVKKFRIDLLPVPGVIHIYQIQVHSFFGTPITFTPENILHAFVPNADVKMVYNGKAIEVIAIGEDPYIELKTPIKFVNNFISVIVPFFLALITVLTLRHLTFLQIYAVRDVVEKKPSTARNIDALDGLRGFAALLVLADHSGVEAFQGVGATGVWIFFCLSGFLLAIPFVHEPAKIVSWSYLRHYFLRRIMRILPMYYFILMVTFLFRGHYDNFFRHILFLQADGIFWSVPQEMYFYMILPVVILFNFLCFRKWTALRILATLVLVLAFNHMFTTNDIWFCGNGKQMFPLIGYFLSGVCMSYFYYSKYFELFRKNGRIIANTLGLFVFCGVLCSSDFFLDAIFHKEVHYTWVYSHIFSYLAALLLICVLLDKQSLIAKIMSTYALRAVGIVGFSFYLIHPNVLDLVQGLSLQYLDLSENKMFVFLVTIVLTYFFSVLTYSLIERPFLFKKAEGPRVNSPYLRPDTIATTYN